jgi:amidohydrolase
MRRERLFSEIEGLVAGLRTIRHDLHRHPELGFAEHRTQSVVRAELERLGYRPRPSAETGLIADLHDDRPPLLAFRADLDALPIQEDLPLPYRSIHDGRAHKCGHDGHTTILLGVAAVLARMKDEIPGNIRLLFQPAEEGVRGGGARVMVEEGALVGVKEVYGLHNWPAFPEGEVRVTAGPIMAAIHRFDIVLRGKGGHGSQPQLCRDPIVAGAQLVTALQTLVSRELSHQGGAVVSVGSFQAGTTDNIIPETARLKGTIRSFEPEITARILERFRAVCRGVAEALGVQADVDLHAGYPVLVNDPGCAQAVREVAERVVGPGRVGGAGLPIAASEDFAYFSAAVPGAYFFLGAGQPGEETPMCHHPNFDFNDRLIPLGMEMFLGLVADRLPALQARGDGP